MTLREDIRNLARVRENSILGVKYLGAKTLCIIQKWQKGATFSDELEYTACMIYDDAMRLLELKEKINELTKQIDILNSDSIIASHIKTIPGFSTISAGELAGEIGTLKRFESEGSLALYLGMTNLDNSSGKQKGSKRNLATNRHAKNAMITATMKHVMYTDESKKYLNKKLSEGKRYQQAIRSIGRHLVRVIWSMIQNDRSYEIR